MKVTVEVTPDSERALRVRLDTARKGVAKGLTRGIQKAVISLESYYKKDILHGGIVQSHSGNLSRSTFSRMLGEFTGVVGWGKEAPYARFVNDGTKPHVITSHRSTVAAAGRSGLDVGGIKTAGSLRFLIGGVMLFRHSVNHPGNRPFNFAQIGLRQFTPNIREIITAEVNKGLKGE